MATTVTCRTYVNRFLQVLVVVFVVACYFAKKEGKTALTWRKRVFLERIWFVKHEPTRARLIKAAVWCLWFFWLTSVVRFVLRLRADKERWILFVVDKEPSSTRELLEPGRVLAVPAPMSQQTHRFFLSYARLKMNAMVVCASMFVGWFALLLTASGVSLSLSNLQRAPRLRISVAILVITFVVAFVVSMGMCVDIAMRAIAAMNKATIWSRQMNHDDGLRKVGQEDAFVVFHVQPDATITSYHRILEGERILVTEPFVANVFSTVPEEQEALEITMNMKKRDGGYGKLFDGSMYEAAVRTYFYHEDLQPFIVVVYDRNDNRFLFATQGIAPHLIAIVRFHVGEKYVVLRLEKSDVHVQLSTRSVHYVAIVQTRQAIDVNDRLVEQLDQVVACVQQDGAVELQDGATFDMGLFSPEWSNEQQRYSLLIAPSARQGAGGGVSQSKTSAP